MNFRKVTRLCDNEMVLVNMDGVAEISPMSKRSGAIPFNNEASGKTINFSMIAYHDGEVLEVAELISFRDKNGFRSLFLGDEFLSCYSLKPKDEQEG